MLLPGRNEGVRLGVTLEEGLQDAVHDAFWQEPPLEDGVVGAAGADDPLQVIGPADVRHVSRVADVLLKFSPCLRKKTTQRLQKDDLCSSCGPHERRHRAGLGPRVTGLTHAL